MNRRGFLSGVIAAVGSTSLIVEATPQDIQTFAKHQPVDVTKSIRRQEDIQAVQPGLMLYDKDGQLRAVVTSVNFPRREQFEATKIGDDYTTYIRGVVHRSAIVELIS